VPTEGRGRVTLLLCRGLEGSTNFVFCNGDLNIGTQYEGLRHTGQEIGLLGIVHSKFWWRNLSRNGHLQTKNEMGGLH
jgi:hypothetical protein